MYIALIAASMGAVLEYFYDYRNGIWIMLCLIAAIVITLQGIKGYLVKLEEIEKNVKVGDVKLSVLIRKNRKLIYSIWPFIFTFSTLCIYFFNFYTIRYIGFDAIGVYATILTMIALTLGMLGYSQYLILIIFLYKISETRITNFNRLIPSETEWIKDLAKLGKSKGIYFSIVGMLYTLAYLLLIPVDDIQVILDESILGYTISLHTVNNPVFIFSWLVIFVLIVIAIPLLFQLQRYFIKKIITQLKEKSSREFYKLMRADKKINTNSLDQQTTLLPLLRELISSPNYPFNEKEYAKFVAPVLTAGFHLVKIVTSLA